MTANEVPEKIYLQVCGDCNITECDNCKFEDLEDNITWCKDKIFEKDVEYTRTDAFIKKACKWLEDNLWDYWGQKNAAPDSFIEDFKNYLKK